jgi:hypothetical protein
VKAVEPDDDPLWGKFWEAQDDAAVLIEPGDYQARVVGAPKIRKLYDSERLVLTFELVQGANGGVRLEFYAEIRTGKHSRFREAWEVAADKHAQRKDRMPLYVFKNRLFLVRVRTVKTNRFQKQRARPYSVIDSILERIA